MLGRSGSRLRQSSLRQWWYGSRGAALIVEKVLLLLT